MHAIYIYIYNNLVDISHCLSLVHIALILFLHLVCNNKSQPQLLTQLISTSVRDTRRPRGTDVNVRARSPDIYLSVLINRLYMPTSKCANQSTRYHLIITLIKLLHSGTWWMVYADGTADDGGRRASKLCSPSGV